jgi:RNA polymerase sigma factor for flagellar operon FliA
MDKKNMLASKIDNYTQVQSVSNPSLSLVNKHNGLVRKIAYKLLSRLPASVQVEDLMQEGMIGLLESSKSYTEVDGASFETFAGIRIYGAMIDSLRRSDWTPRSVSKNIREVSVAKSSLSSLLKREPSDMEVSEKLGLSLSDYQVILADMSYSQVMGIDDIGISQDVINKPSEDNIISLGEYITSDNPDKNIEMAKFQQELVKVIRSLPEKESLVLSLYYNEDLNLKEIGLVIDVSESRVSQILKISVGKLKSKMSHWVD